MVYREDGPHLEVVAPIISTTSLPCVDFDHPELCTGCDPVTCVVEGISFMGKNWRDLLVALTEYFLSNKPQAKELYSRSVYPNGERPFLLKDRPLLSARQISNGYWIYMNLGIKDLVFTIGKLCLFCSVNLADVEITYVAKANVGLRGMPVHKIADNSEVFAQQNIRAAFKVWLAERQPSWSTATVQMHCSDAYYLYNNERGVSLSEALTTDNGFQRAYDAIEQYFTANPTQTNSPSGSTRGYLRSLQMLKEFLVEKYPSLLNISSASLPTVPDAVFSILRDDYANGFRFDTTALRLLSRKAGVEIDENMQNTLKRQMFCRDDGIYFLFDHVADVGERNEIVQFANILLEEYGCFEVSELYELYAGRLNAKIVGNADNFERFYEQIGNRGVRCVAAPYIGNRIARLNNASVWGKFEAIADKIIAMVNDEFGGVISEDDLHAKFCAFSVDLLAKIIKHRAEDRLIRTEINGIVCYQTLEALGLPENFADTLAETLERLSELNLAPNEEALHTALSLALNVNFKVEYNLPTQEIYRRLIAVYYKGAPRRQWYRGVFGEEAE